ncbi:MAG: porin family protein [Bacteroidetes bacterium]|nr:porin family protein [Bacteroidota bacterium]
MRISSYIIALLLTTCTIVFGQDTIETNAESKKESGFEAKIEAGYFGGTFTNVNLVIYNSGFGAFISPGYRVNDYFAFYPGVGIERYEDGILIPFFIDFESYIFPKKRAYIDVRLGYSTGFSNQSINIQYNYKGGFLAGAGMGWKLYKNEHLRLALQASYEYRKARYTYQPFTNSSEVVSDFDYQMFSVRLVFSLR